MRKFLKIITLVLLLIALLFTFRNFADFGDFSGDSDYGGGYSSDYSSDYSSGYDSDFGGGFLIGSLFGGNSSSGEFIIFAIIVIAILYRVLKQNKGRGGQSRQAQPGATPTSGLQPLHILKASDPNFSEDNIKQRLSKLYIQMQHGWTAKDITPLRGDFTDEQFAQYDRQLQRYRDEQQTNVVERIAVLDVNIMGVKQDEAHDILVANISARVVSYTVDDRTGNLLQGSKTAEKFMRYEWTLIRPKGAKTAAQTGDSAFTCPNCGGAMNINHSARCPFCDSIVTKSRYDWVISGIKGLSQRTK